MSGTSVASSAEGGEEAGGNNLATPVIFAEGFGLSGTAVDETDITSTGLPGLLKPACAGVESWAAGSDAVSFPETDGLYDLDINGTVYDQQLGQTTAAPGDYFLQPYSFPPLAGGPADAFGDETCWEASWADGSAIDMVEVNALDVGDSIVRVLRKEGSNPIRVEFSLYQSTETPGTFQDGLALDGYPMTQLWPPGFSDGKPPSVGSGERLEVWATADSGGAGSLEPAELATVFTQNARLSIDKLTWTAVPDSFANGDLEGYPSGKIPDTFDAGYDQWVESVEYDGLVGGEDGEGGFSAEVNQGGRALYGYNWGLGEGVDTGWYRITLSFDDLANGAALNAMLTGINAGDQLADESEGGSDSGSKGFFPPHLVESPDGNYMYLDVYIAPDGSETNPGKMSGKVTNNLGSQVEGIDVTLFDGGGTPRALAVTGADGSFETSVPAGTYRVGFSDQTGVYFTEFFDDEDSLAAAKVLNLTANGAEFASAELWFFLDVLAGDRFPQEILWLKQEGITTGTSPTMFSPAESVTREQMAAFLGRFWRSSGGTCPTDPAPFTDVRPTSYAKADINCIYGLGITTGTSPTTYSPNENVTREQMAAFLGRFWRASGGTCPTDPAPFTDVRPTSYAKADINCIYGLGVTTGTSPTTYSPDDDVTREQMAAFLYRVDQLG